MPLQSDLFRGDVALEAAAVSDAAHITIGASGDHVGKIQRALNILDQANLREDGQFGNGTAAAVLNYKRDRAIINRTYQQAPDAIVGKMTVVALDQELARGQAITPVVIIGKAGLGARSRLELEMGATPEETPNPFKMTSVVRGLRYQSSNATPFPGLPPSIPPHKTYEVDITIQPPLSGGQAVDIEIINGSSNNGDATVTPAKLQKSGKVVVTGTRQTVPGNGGQLRIQASLGGQVLATSEGFTVCAHPSAIRIVSSKRLEEPGSNFPHTGIEVTIQIESDSGAVGDLDQALMNELVEEILPRQSPPFSASGQLVVAPAYMRIGTGRGTDQHGYRPFPGGPAGKITHEQVHIFKCNRCGAKHIPIAASGFEIVGEVFTDDRGKTWKLKVTKEGTATGVQGISPDQGEPPALFKAGAGIGKAQSIPPEVIKGAP